MQESLSIDEVTLALGQSLRRAIWQPLHRLMGIFHLLPPAAAIILLLLFTDVGQLRELYLSYLEDLDPVRIFWAFAGVTLISAALYESHYWLSTMRIEVIYSSLSYPNAGTNLRRLQRVAAFTWSLLPWLGLAAGLFFTRTYLAKTAARLCRENLLTRADLASLQTLPEVGTWPIVTSILALGLVVAIAFDCHRKSRVVQTVIVVVTPTAALAAALLLAGFYAMAADAAAFAAAALIVITAYYVGLYRLIDTQQIHRLYSSFWHEDTGINPRRRHRVATFLWVLLPWVASGLFVLGRTFVDSKQTTADAADVADLCQNLPAIDASPIIAVAVILVIAAGLTVALAMDRFRQRLLLRRAVAVAIAVPIIIAATMQWFNFDAVYDFRMIGPMGSLALAYLFIFSSFALLALLSQKSGFPAVTLALTAIGLSVLFHVPIATTAKVLVGVCAVFVFLALISRLWAVALVATILGGLAFCTVWREGKHSVDVATLQIPPKDSVRDLQTRFGAWLQHRTDRDSGKPYPVFIISTEGGGIYAAAAASVFLAKLQDDCPAFAQHVFAISGVSGGAIGATIFQALAEGQPASKSADCHPRQTDGPLTQDVMGVVGHDHFSPVVGSIVPDLLGEKNGRAEALEQSFEASDNKNVEDRLEQDYLDHWREDSVAPALVLNATWAETGYRVAFAPFTLSKTSDGTLYSFADAKMPGENIKLMDAAVVSARFPGILPPFSVKMSDDHWWNFVDGGYADSSGAATALALFSALKPLSCSAKVRVPLRLIMLSDTNLKPNFSDLNGSDFRDTMTPIEAIAKVRELLGNQAVTRASDELKTPAPCDDPSASPNWSVAEIKLEDEEYALPLGWKISKTTLQLVSLLIGRPEPCPPPPQRTDPSAQAPAVTQVPTVTQVPATSQISATNQTPAASQAPPASELPAAVQNRCVMQLIEQALSTN
jgi:hypothetical protein